MLSVVSLFVVVYCKDQQRYAIFKKMCYFSYHRGLFVSIKFIFVINRAVKSLLLSQLIVAFF